MLTETILFFISKYHIYRIVDIEGPTTNLIIKMSHSYKKSCIIREIKRKMKKR